jgi:hypothetical protein
MKIRAWVAAAWTAPFLLALQLNAGNVVSDWTAIASTTIVKNGGQSPGASSVFFTYASLAAYDAVNAITGQYQPFYYRIAGPPDASVDAAAVAAAHRVLVNYFPSQKAALDTQYAMSLANITATADAKTEGMAVGESAAMALISARSGDGLEANITYTPGSIVGAWIPTPPAYLQPLTPWLGQMRPFTMIAPDEYLPSGPTPLASEAWKRDFVLTRTYGGSTSTLRSAAETEIGLYWTENGGQQYARSFSYLIADYNLGTADSARLMAMLWTGFADAAIGCFNAKYKYGFWRPVTAAAAGGGSTDIASADPGWLPLGVTPNHPEYPAAHGCITGAVSQLIATFFGTTRVQVRTDSLVFSDGVHQHTFQDTRDLMDEVFWARIYAGFHYHHSLEDGRQLGQTVASNLARSHFQPKYGRRSGASADQAEAAPVEGSDK